MAAGCGGDSSGAAAAFQPLPEGLQGVGTSLETLLKPVGVVNEPTPKLQRLTLKRVWQKVSRGVGASRAQRCACRS